jgi:SET domain-containing protein
LDINFQGVILNYVFTSDNENKSVVVFGYGSIYNHQDDYDVEWEIKNGNTMIITAIKDIPKGKEIYNNYGDEYWEERNDIQKIII